MKGNSSTQGPFPAQRAAALPRRPPCGANRNKEPESMPSTPTAGPESAPVFSEHEVLCRTPLAESGELLDRMVRLLAERDPAIDPQAALRAVLDREAEAPVFLAPGVAMPHARLEGLERTLAAVATSEGGVRFPGAEGPARLVVLVLAPVHEPAGYLRVAAGVARRLQDPAFLDEVVRRDAPAAVCDLFRRGSAELPEFVCAADIMERPSAVLRETDSVKDAIDLIVRTGRTEIPVVDKEGALVGEASADEVLGLCIPDYLLWMEDLSVFSNFEPFATLLRKEASTWMADILSDDYASVKVDQPAIAVAEALARKDAGVCYVLDGDKLAGVVTLPHFLNKVFRD